MPSDPGNLRQRLRSLLGAVWRHTKEELKNFDPSAVAVGNTSTFIKLGNLRSLKTSIVVGLLVNLASHSLPASLASSISAALVERTKRLTESEKEVFRTMRKLAAGSPYSVWLSQDVIVSALDPDKTRDDHLRLLANMKSRGLLEEGAGKWRAVW
jgi:hypothetical protein